MAVPGESPQAVPFEPATPLRPSIPAPEIQHLPGEWTTALTSACNFGPDIFIGVMQNLLKNPNITTSHLFRADIFYDSDSDSSTFLQTVGPAEHDLGDETERDLAKLSLSADSARSTILSQIKEEYKPIPYDIAGYTWQRTVVRSLVPRNRQLDRDMLQTCHFYHRRAGPVDEDSQAGKGGSSGDDAVEMVIYAPHVQSAAQVPWYHPPVRSMALTHTASDPQKLGIHFELFPSSDPAAASDKRLNRTCLGLLSTIHRHGTGQKAGYEKRVNHDLVVPQQVFQDTYAMLKKKYARELITSWVETTDPTKHVFEDLGIAAFLIELWRGMYQSTNGQDDAPDKDTTIQAGKRPFPGFVDIGCGNGVLVNILLREGYQGWGFDARKRKTWSTFSPEIQDQVSESVLVPSVLAPDLQRGDPQLASHHNGVFPEGTFIISNHADELTPWTPLLAYINKSNWIAIPCCSHDLTGARFRAPERTRRFQEEYLAKVQDDKRKKADAKLTGTSNAVSTPDSNADGPGADHPGGSDNEYVSTEARIRVSQAAETGTLKTLRSTPGTKRTPGKPASAYSTLCDYVTSLASEIGYEDVQREMLRIPSTRNACIVGRWKDGLPAETLEERTRKVQDLVCRETDSAIEHVGRIWIEKASAITSKKGEH